MRSGLAEIFGIRCSTARWKSSFSITPRARARPGFIADREVQRQDVSRLEQVLERRQRSWVRPADRRLGVGARGGQNVAVDGRVVVEQRQEHDDAFGDGRAQARVEPAPAVRVPAVDGVELVPALGPAAALRAAARRTGHLARVEERFELGLVRVRHVVGAFREPVRPRRLRRSARW